MLPSSLSDLDNNSDKRQKLVNRQSSKSEYSDSDSSIKIRKSRPNRFSFTRIRRPSVLNTVELTIDEFPWYYAFKTVIVNLFATTGIILFWKG